MVRYYINAIISRQYSRISKEEDFGVYHLKPDPEVNPPISLEVGIEDCLHLQIEFERSKFHLKDVILGKVTFNLIRIKLKSLELSIIKKETYGSTGS